MTRVFIPPTVKHIAREHGVGYSVAISVTGTECDLMCRHCYARTLEYMYSVDRGLELVETASGYPRMVLISGGCDCTGRVPIDHRFKELVLKAKSNNFVIAMHTCVVDYSYAKTLLELGIDVVLIDIELDPIVVNFVRNLYRYDENVLLYSLETIKRIGLRVFPHVVVGLHPCGRGLEYEAIDVLTTMDIDGLSIVVFTPLPGTPFEDRPYPDKHYVRSIMKYAEARISKPIALGCMRPREWVDIEEYALDLGYEAIANPSLMFLQRHRDLEIYNLCCSYITLCT